MYSKKSILKILSVGLAAFCGLSCHMNVSAISMARILPDITARRNSPLKKCKDDTLSFIDGEMVRLREQGADEDDFKRMDSLAFAVFCYSCYKNDLMVAIRNVVPMRSAGEMLEDMEVLGYIIPNNARYFKDRFGIEVVRSELDELINYITEHRKIKSYGKSQRKPEREMREIMREGVDLAKYKWH